MAWISQHKNWVRWVGFVLLLIAILGPWAYQGDGVPPPEFCHPPFILLENGSWVGRMSGATIISFFTLAIPQLISQLLSGELVLAERGREFLVILPALLLVILPVASTLLRVKYANSRSYLIFSIISWGLAVAMALLIAAFVEVFHPNQLWGVWLYAAVAGAMLAWEVYGLIVSMRKPLPAPFQSKSLPG